MNNNLIITPFGGVGEIGSNMTVFQSESASVIVDCGILFPYEESFAINYLIPDWKAINQLPDPILVITHGHEDHIGAIGHFVNEFPKIKIYAPKFAKILIEKKLSILGLNKNITEYDAKDTIVHKDITVDPIQVNHSIPDTYGLIVAHNKNKIVFISDFKFTNEGYFEPEIDTGLIQSKLRGAKNILAMLDSTNILNSGNTWSEKSLITDIHAILKTNRRIFVTLFASNIMRIQTILSSAKKHGKKVVPVGRSVEHYINSANYLLKDTDVLEELSNADLESNNYVYILSGCQGDYLGALRRVSSGEHPQFSINKNDLFVFSSKVIPGNEKKIARIYNKIIEQGAEVITAHEKRIHASGHAAQEDLKKIIDVISPTHYIPIHGESFLLNRHYSFVKNNYPQIETYQIHNFNKVSFSDEITIEEHEVLPPRIIHGSGKEIDRSHISERRKLATSGSLFACIDLKNKRFEVKNYGLAIECIPNFDADTTSIVAKHIKSKNNVPEQIAEQIRIDLRNYVYKVVGVKPMTFVHVF